GSNNLSILLGNGNGTFQAQTTFALGSNPIHVGASHQDGDGRPDLVVTNWQSNSVSLLLNAANGNFTGQTYTIDNTAPFVQSINRTTPPGPVTSATSVTYTVTFSESVTGVDASDFQVVATGSVATTQPVVVSGSGAVYAVTVHGIA